MESNIVPVEHECNLYCSDDLHGDVFFCTREIPLSELQSEWVGRSICAYKTGKRIGVIIDIRRAVEADGTGQSILEHLRDKYYAYLVMMKTNENYVFKRSER